MTDPIEDAYRKLMNDIAHALDDGLNGKVRPKKVGFVILMFDFNNPDTVSEGRMNYISNSNREDMLVALKELVANFEGRMMDGGTA